MEIYIITSELGEEVYSSDSYEQAISELDRLQDLHGTPFDLSVEA